MSGTSMDGIDAVLVGFEPSGVNIRATASTPYPAELRELLLAAAREPLDVLLDTDGDLDRRVGECFRDAALGVLAQAGDNPVFAIGSHGQTLRHQPNATPPYSLQIGDPALIAGGSGVTTVANFRAADILAGGQGAPLVPPFHQWLLQSSSHTRTVVNIGGIANITLLPADGSDASGFDTGPGNGLMDAWIREKRGHDFDEDGRWAAEGKLIQSLLDDMLSDPYFAADAPKSTGFEYFNLNWLNRFDVDRFPAVDVQSTLCELTAATVAAPIKSRADEVFVCGGGIHNPHLMHRLQQHLDGITVDSTASAGLHPDWVEAVAFAWLAMRTVNGQTGNLPSVTGATHKVVLGDIHSPQP
jgi:anhydro-N-acetylmuramic acid kinase